MSEPFFNDERAVVWRLQEVCVLLEAPREHVLELVEYRSGGSLPEEFDRQWLQWLGRSLRLQRDLGLDSLAAAVISDLIERNAALERRLQLVERLAGFGTE
jgi:hypothetical protein